MGSETPQVARVKRCPEYLLNMTPPDTIVLCPQCRSGVVAQMNQTCIRCGYRGPGHTYTLTRVVGIVLV